MDKVIVLLLLILFITEALATPSAVLQDKNDKTLRITHLTLHNISLDKAREITDQIKASGFNTIQVVLSDGLIFEHAPWKPISNAWSKAEFLSWVSYARARSLDIVPEINLLTHQERFFQNLHPQLMFNKSTYDPRNEKTFEVVFTFIDEIIEAIQPRAIHIGHDEVAGHLPYSAKKWLRSGEEMLPATLFLKNVTQVHAYLKRKGIETWMWGDMLISSNEFPNMLAKHLHGNSPGYGKNLRDQLPRDIVICDWHYFDEQTEFPSLSTLQQEGFRVIATTWKNERAIRNFSRYAKNHNAYGMMATIWFYLPRNEMELVNWIIQTSGKLFQNPDATVLPQPK
ncbi:MAG: family 20 glycosylhydrolase [Nitrosomonas sp.]|nr:family 20 glycosylhydrolase [Nitrosomonas sp.]MBK7364455.1 family 20 glycosylhydrolase [Nitrosomonas sp.]